MGLSLRIDVDNPFGYANFLKKVLNRISLDYNLIPRSSFLGYLENAEKLRKHLDANSIAATWFFRNATTPKKHDISAYCKGRFDVGLHAERTNTFEDFTEEIDQWKKAFSKQPAGFTKHGSGDQKLSRMHSREYDEEAFIRFGNELGFKYFIGNGVHYSQKFELREGLVFISGAFWLDNITLHPADTTLDDVIKISQTENVIVLVHPIWWAINSEVRDRLQYLIERCDFKSIEEEVREFREMTPNSKD